MAFTGQLGIADSRPANIELGGPVALTAFPTMPRVMLEINWDDNPTLEEPESEFENVSHRLRSWSTNRGRPTQFDRVEAGTLTLVMDNRDGYFNPEQTGRLLLRMVRLKALWDAVEYPLFYGYIDSYRYEYPGLDYDAVCVLTVSDGIKILAMQQFGSEFTRSAENTSTRLEAVLVDAGVGLPYQDVNSATINNDDNLAPARVIASAESTQTRSCTLANGDATVTLASDTTSGITEGMAVNGTGVPSGTTVLSVTDSTHFEMSANAVLSMTDRVGRGSDAPGNTVLTDVDTTNISVGMTVGPNTNQDGQQLFGSGGTNTATVTAVQGSTVVVTPPTRFVTWWDGGDPPGTVNATFTASTSQTLTFPLVYLEVGGVLEHIRQIEATERGLLVLLPDGTFQYQGVDWRPGQSVQLTFGENVGEIRYSEVPIAYDDTGLINEYVLRNVNNDTETVITDATSQSRYFRRVEQIDQIWASNITGLPTEQRAFEPIPRLQGIEVKPMRDPLNVWQPILNLAISDKVDVRRRPRTNGFVDIFSAYDQFIEGIQHDAEPGKHWTVTFITSPVRT